MPKKENIPFCSVRKRSIKALELATQTDKQILLVAQKSADEDEPKADKLFTVGCLANILQLLKLPDGNVKVLVEGVSRVQVEEYQAEDDVLIATIDENIVEIIPAKDIELLQRTILGTFENYVKLNRKIPQEILTSLSGIEEPSRLTDTIAAHLPLKVSQKQEILEMQIFFCHLNSLGISLIKSTYSDYKNLYPF